jgi:hypothetical protein
VSQIGRSKRSRRKNGRCRGNCCAALSSILGLTILAGCYYVNREIEYLLLRIVNGKIIIIAMSVALLIAVVLLIVGVGRIVFGIAHYYLRERKPVRELQHPQLELLTSSGTDSSLWEGRARIDDRDVPFIIAGSETAPDDRLVAQLQSIMARFGSLERQAIEFLRSRESEVRDSKLVTYLLVVSDERRHDDFTFEFIDSANDSQVWRVEFVDGEPKHTGFDD